MLKQWQTCGFMMTALESLQFGGSDVEKQRIKFCYSFYGTADEAALFPQRVIFFENSDRIRGTKVGVVLFKY